MAKKRSAALRKTLKAQKEYREEEQNRHFEDLAIWIGKRGPVGPKLAVRVGMTPDGRF